MGTDASQITNLDIPPVTPDPRKFADSRLTESEATNLMGTYKEATQRALMSSPDSGENALRWKRSALSKLDLSREPQVCRAQLKDKVTVGDIQANCVRAVYGKSPLFL